MKIYTLSTFTDWAHQLGCYGPLGMERVFDWLKVAGIERVYWRAFNGGRANYPSKIAHVLKGTELGGAHQLGDGGGPAGGHFWNHVDCTQGDELNDAVRLGRERGIEVCIWWTLCEEAHGLHVLSDWGKRADIRMHDRDGNDYPGTVEFGLKEVRKQKLAILGELLACKPDGLLLDFIRHNATPSGDQRGIHRFGYNPEIRAAFKRKHGKDPVDLRRDDPTWLAYKNGYRADFVRAIRKRLGKKRRLDVMTIPHVNNYKWLCLDLPSLTKDGTLDLVIPTDMTHCNAPATVRKMVRDLRKQVRGKAQVGATVQGYWGNLEPDAYDAAVQAAEKAKADAFVLYESDQLMTYDLLTPTRAYHLGAPRPKRQVTVKRLDRSPTDSDWKKAKAHSGFFSYAFADRVKAIAATSFRVLADKRSLHMRIDARGTQGEPSEALVREKKVFVDWIGARNYWQFFDSVHLCLDPAPGSGASPTRKDFTHYIAHRGGELLQETRIDNHWDGKWSAKVEQVSNTHWQATLSVPFATAGCRPKAGDRWGMQVYRTHQPTGEVSSYFVGTRYGIDPREWGDLVFG